MQELIIKKRENKKQIALVENGKLQEFYEEEDGKIRQEGSICIGKVKDVLPGMQAAFVDIGEEKAAFLHIKDCLPKVSNATGNKQERLNEYPIGKYIKKGEMVLVQVKRDSLGQKGARISKDIQIAGKFTILLPGNHFITVSQKIEEEDEKNRLKEIVKEQLQGKEYGIIIRTAALKQSAEKIQKDIQNIIKQWDEILQTFKGKKKEESIEILYHEKSVIDRLLLDLAENELKKIVIEDKTLAMQIEKRLKELQIDKKIPIEIKEDIENIYGIEEQIEQIQKRKIWLKCGGFITIDRTEALTAVDVNSGKFTGKQELEQTALKVNKEASVEIAKQLRVRDIGGIIVIDYIDMQEEEHKQEVRKVLQDALKQDRAKTQIMDFTKLNLLEMTRKAHWGHN